MTCQQCDGRKWIGGDVPRLCGACGASGLVPEPKPEPDYHFRLEQEDINTWREAAAFFAVCAALAETSGALALEEMFRTLYEQADKRADELDEAEVERVFEGGELVRPPTQVWRRR
jgi:hypothetical protein